MRRQSPPDDLQVSIDFPSSGASPPHPAPAPAPTRRLRALDEDIDQFSEKEHAEEVNSERGPLRDVVLLRWGLSSGTNSLQC